MMSLLYRIIATVIFIIFLDVTLWAVCTPPTIDISCIIPSGGFGSSAIVEAATAVTVTVQNPTNAALASTSGVTITSSPTTPTPTLKLVLENISLNAPVGSTSNPFYIWFDPSSGPYTATLTEPMYASAVCLGTTDSACTMANVNTSDFLINSGGDLIVQNNIQLGPAAILTVNAANSLSAASIQGVGSGNGTVQVNANNTLPPIGATYPIRLLQIASDSTVTLSGNTYLSNTGGVDVLNIASGSTLVACASCTINTGSTSQLTNDGTIQLNVTDNNTYAQINAVGTINPAATGNYVINPTSKIRSNTTLSNIVLAPGVWSVTGGIEAINALFSITQPNIGVNIVDTSGTLTEFAADLTVLTTWLDALEANSLSINQKDVINALSAVASSDTTVYDALDDSVTLGNIAPFVDSIAGMALPTSIVATQVPNMIANVISDRLNLVHNNLGQHYTGVNSGDSNNISKGGWAQPFTSHAHQGTKDLISGYKSNTGGLAVGFDTVVKDITLGVALSYADTHMRGSSFGSPKYHVNTIQGTLYSSYNISNWYLDALVYYGRNYYKSHSDLQEIGRRSGKYNGYQIGGKLGLAYKIYRNEFEIVPKATINYGNIHTNSYTETGASSLNRMMAKSNYNSSTADAMVNLAKPVKIKDGGVFVPSVNFGAGYDIKSNNIVNTASFVGASTIPYQLYGIKPARASVKGGVNLAYKFDDAMSLATDYMCEKRSKYINHSAYLNFHLAF